MGGGSVIKSDTSNEEFVNEARLLVPFTQFHAFLFARVLQLC